MASKFGNGLSAGPGQVSSLASRLVCKKCFIEPKIKSADVNKDTGAISFTVSCHGETESHSVIGKSELLRLFPCFVQPEEIQKDGD